LTAIDLDCKETVKLTRSKYWDKAPNAEEDFLVNVTKKACVLETCDTGFIQDLYTCGCIKLETAQGNVVDLTSTSQIRLAVGTKFTVREFAATSADYTYKVPDFSSDICVKTVGTSYEDPWFRYRQTVYETT